MSEQDIKPENTAPDTNEGANNSSTESSNDSSNDNSPIIAASFVPSSAENSAVEKQSRLPRYLAATVLCISALIMWFLFSSKSVVITTIPSVANVEIKGTVHINLDDHLLMRTGKYQLSAELNGYYPLVKEFTVTEEQNQKLTFNFTPLPGELALQTNVDKIDNSLVVKVDGELVKLENGVINNISAGKHQVYVTAKNYFEHSQTINILGKRERQQLTVSLKPAWANINITSSPSSVELYLKDELIGTTPTTIKLLEGDQSILFKKDGYQHTSRKIGVIAEQDKTLPTVPLFKLQGQLAITSKPSGVSVTYGEQYLGTTPLSVAVIPNKKQPLLLFKDGYQAQTHQLVVESGQSTNKQFTLSPIIASVNFQVTPSDALLYVEGRLMGRANKPLSLPSKQQHIRIEKEGFVDYQTSILPTPNSEQVFTVKLKTIEQAKWENIKPIITTATGSKLKLFKINDSFVTGASRREQGRRANEIKRSIHLAKPFYLGLMEITNKEFKQFLRSHSSGNVKGNSLNASNQPVVNITWIQAALFCNWLSEKENLIPVYQIENNKLVSFDLNQEGYRLPTEAEWAWASRFNTGNMLKYSWGKNLPPTENAGNFADISGASILGTIIPRYNDKYIASAPVGSFTNNNKGLFDLAGNVAEWQHDFYEINTGLSLTVEKDPSGPLTGDYHVIRGSSWAHGSQTTLRLSYRDYGNDKRNDVGFRIARYVN